MNKNILTNFIQESIPGTVLEAANQVLNNEQINIEFDVKTTNSFTELQALFTENGETISTEVSFQEDSELISYYCNCTKASSGVCKHISATILNFLNPAEKLVTQTQSTSNNWRNCFHSFFTLPPVPDSGQHYIIYRFFPEPGRLQIEFFRARQNKAGISNIQLPVTLEQIISKPEWTAHSPALVQIAAQVGYAAEYYGQRIEIPAAIMNSFFWAIKDEFYLFFKDTDLPIKIQQTPLQLQLLPEVVESGLEINIGLVEPEKSIQIINAKHTFFYGNLPLWVYRDRCFYPAQTSLDLEIVKNVLETPTQIPKSDIGMFFERVWSKFSFHDIYNEEPFLEKLESYFVPATYNPRLYLNEEGSLLTLEIQNCYDTLHGEVVVGNPSNSYRTGSYTFNGETHLIKRTQHEEKKLIETLTELKFQPRNASIWFLEQEAAIEFLLQAYPELVAKYRIFGERDLTRYKVRFESPIASAEINTDKNEQWFNLQIDINYGETSVPIEQIWEAWQKNKRYVQLKDGSYANLPEEWLKRMQNKLTALGLDSDLAPKKNFELYEVPTITSILDEINDAKTDHTWEDLKNKTSDFTSIEAVKTPKSINAILRPYQVEGLTFLNFLWQYKFGGILADEMGLGKTLQTLSFLQLLKDKGTKNPFLIIVPTSILPNWDREAEKFAPNLSRLTIYGAQREQLLEQIPKTDLVITTYALIRRDIEFLHGQSFGAIILDEAQNIKNSSTITARAIRKLRSDFRLCLSGTPVENTLLELWSLFEFLMPGFLGSQSKFQSQILKPIREGNEETLKFLKARVKPFVLRRTKSEVAKDLPPKVETVHYSAMLEEQEELYTHLARKFKEQILQDVNENGIQKNQLSILDALLKLRQISCHPKLLKLDMPGFSNQITSGKFETFKGLVTNIIDEGHKVLVFSQFVQMLHIIRDWLKIENIPFSYLDGSSKDRMEQVDTFNNTPEIPVFLISLKAGGVGLNLTSADYVIHYDPWWNPAVENQATDRTHRIGQTRQVFSYKLICKNTVEEKILQLQQSKKGLADSIISDKQVWSNLTKQDLEMLFDM